MSSFWSWEFRWSPQNCDYIILQAGCLLFGPGSFAEVLKIFQWFLVGSFEEKQDDQLKMDGFQGTLRHFISWNLEELVSIRTMNSTRNGATTGFFFYRLPEYNKDFLPTLPVKSFGHLVKREHKDESVKKRYGYLFRKETQVSKWMMASGTSWT